jgi:hypothetical protein
LGLFKFINGKDELNTRGSKYEPLNKLLKLEGLSLIVMTFLEVEEILGFQLPVSTSKYMAWCDDASRTHSGIFMEEAGFKVKPNLKEKKVEFVSFKKENNLE